jgi:hypothetical protein
MNIKVVGIDLVKNIFQVCVLLENNSIQSNLLCQDSCRVN